MDNKPDIKRAIPQRRYSVGEFGVVVLGEIETGGSLDYRYIMAVVREGDPEPGLYITCEKAGGGLYRLRLIMRGGEEVVAEDAGYADLDMFSEAGIEMVREILNLADEEPYRLM